MRGAEAQPGGSFYIQLISVVYCDMNPLKIPMTLEQQIALLKSRGLTIGDDARAKDILAHLNYYRIINAYSLGLYDTSPENIQKLVYRPGVSLEQLNDIYQFDTKLRHIIFELIEYFELKFRTDLAYYIGNNFCATAYLRPELYFNKEHYLEFIQDLEREKAVQKRSLIVKHHDTKYNGTMPVWAMVEIVPFGTLSKLYKNMLEKHKRRIAAAFRTYPDLLSSWLNSFVLVRNICAHYGRLYNINLLARPKMPKDSPRLDDYKIFSVIYLLYKLVDDPMLKLSLYYRLKEATVHHTFVELEKIGFPNCWEQILRPLIGLPSQDIATFKKV